MDMKQVQSIHLLSLTQETILFDQTASAADGETLGQLHCRLQGGLDLPEFENSWRQVMDKHPLLRASFVWKRVERPLQVIQQDVAIALNVHDWRSLSQREQSLKLQEFLEADRGEKLDPGRAPLFRLNLFQMSDSSYEFVWSYHRILLDDHSLYIILEEVSHYYEHFHSGKELRFEPGSTFQEYVSWLRLRDISKAEDFWRQTLKGFGEPPNLKIGNGYKNYAGGGWKREEQTLSLNATTVTALHSVMKRHQLDYEAVLQGAWAILLNRYSGEEDVVFGVAISGRPSDLRKSELLIGPLTNTLPMRVQVHRESSALTFLKEVQDHWQVLRQYDYSPLG